MPVQRYDNRRQGGELPFLREITAHNPEQPVVVRFTAPGEDLTLAQRALAQLNMEQDPADGLSLNMVRIGANGLEVLDVWATASQAVTFYRLRLLPALSVIEYDATQLQVEVSGGIASLNIFGPLTYPQPSVQEDDTTWGGTGL